MKCHVFFPIALLFLTAVWVTACTGELTAMVPGDEAIIEPQQGDATMTPVPTPEATEVKPPARVKQVVRLALEDLAQRMGVVPEAIQLVSVEAVEWSDASLGCPQPGMMYAQVITAGYRVVLEVEGRRYEYHTDAGQSVVFCEEKPIIAEPTVPSPVKPGLEGLVEPGQRGPRTTALDWG